MSIETLIAKFGIATIFVGAGIEGEAVVTTGGMMAHRHFFPLWEAMLAATTGTFLADQAWFLLGRHFQHRRWVAKAMRKHAFSHTINVLEKHPTAFIFGFRFVYGLRTISPIAIGTTRVPLFKFMLLNALAAAIWGLLFTFIGYQFDRAIDPLFSGVRHDALYVLSAVVLIALAIGAFMRLNHRPPLVGARRSEAPAPSGAADWERHP